MQRISLVESLSPHPLPNEVGHVLGHPLAPSRAPQDAHDHEGALSRAKTTRLSMALVFFAHDMPTWIRGFALQTTPMQAFFGSRGTWLHMRVSTVFTKASITRSRRAYRVIGIIRARFTKDLMASFALVIEFIPPTALRTDKISFFFQLLLHLCHALRCRGVAGMLGALGSNSSGHDQRPSLGFYSTINFSALTMRCKSSLSHSRARNPLPQQQQHL